MVANTKVPNIIILTVCLFDYYSYTTQLPVAKSFKSQLTKQVIAKHPSLILLFLLFFSLLQHLHFLISITLKPQLLQHKQKHRENKHTHVLGHTHMLWKKKKLYSRSKKRRYSYIIQKQLHTTEHSLRKLQDAQQTFISTSKRLTITTQQISTILWVPQKVKSAKFPQHVREKQRRGSAFFSSLLLNKQYLIY